MIKISLNIVVCVIVGRDKLVICPFIDRWAKCELLGLIVLSQTIDQQFS